MMDGMAGRMREVLRLTATITTSSHPDQLRRQGGEERGGEER